MSRGRRRYGAYSRVAVACAFVLVTGAPRAQAQLSRADSVRLYRAIDSLVSERRLDAAQTASARRALREAARRPDIRDALLFDYAAGTALSWEGEGHSNAGVGEHRHFLARLGAVRRPSGFDPLAMMASRWNPAMGEPKVRYAAFREFTEEMEYDAEIAVFYDTAAKRAVNSYLFLRDKKGVPAAQAHDSVVAQHGTGVHFLQQEVLYPWGHRFLRDYDAFNAGSDARDFFEAHNAYWFLQAYAGRRPPRLFVASDPMAMLSRRIMRGVRDDREKMRAPLSAVLDAVLARPVIAVTPESPDTPSCIGQNPRKSEGDYAAGAVSNIAHIVFSPERAGPTTASNYCDRLLYLRAYAAELAPSDRTAIFGTTSPNRIVTETEDVRRTQGDSTAHAMLDRLIMGMKVTFH